MITHTLTVSGHFKNLAKIGDFIGRVAHQADLNDKDVYAVQMAVDEACSNIIEHAYGGEGKGQIQLTCALKKKGLQVTILDQGIPFKPEQMPKFDPTAPLSIRTSRGMGLFFIHQLVDKVEYHFEPPNGNQLTLFKYRE